MSNQNVDFETTAGAASVTDVETSEYYDLSDFAPEAELVEEIDENPDRNEQVEPVEHIDEELDREEMEQGEEDESPWSSYEREYPYEVPRPALTIDEASTILGKSIRSIERSIQGRWGNKLPEGWQARKMKIDGESEWRIIPPPGFRIRHTSSLWNATKDSGAEESTESAIDTTEVDEVREDHHESTSVAPYDGPKSNGTGLKLPGFGFSLENFLNTAGQRAKTEIARAAIGSSDLELEHPTIVIDRSDDVEKLLRELANTQRELAEERRLHMQDMKIMAEMQSSMRLLEDHASQTSIMKKELEDARDALKQHRQQYEEYLRLPWWQKVFKKAP